MSLRGVWVVDGTGSSVVFSRRFVVVERRARRLAEAAQPSPSLASGSSHHAHAPWRAVPATDAEWIGAVLAAAADLTTHHGGGDLGVSTLDAVSPLSPPPPPPFGNDR